MLLSNMLWLKQLVSDSTCWHNQNAILKLYKQNIEGKKIKTPQRKVSICISSFLGWKDENLWSKYSKLKR